MAQSRRRTIVEERISKRVPIRVLVEYDDLDEFLDDYVANMSLGGMFLARKEPLGLGTRFRLKFRLPSQPKPVETFATVRWVVLPEDGLVPGMGIQFDDLTPSDRRKVERLLTQI